jgi:hypothetical protein
VLQGLAPTGTTKVVVERLGKESRAEGRVAPAGDGSFTVTVRLSQPAAFRARVKRLTSTSIRVAVAPHVKVHLHDGVLSTTARPSRVGAAAVLQKYDREKFAWRTVLRGRVDSASRVSLRLPPGRVGRFRVVVRGSHGWADGHSQAVVRR